MGIVQRSPELLEQVKALKCVLAQSDGWFRVEVDPGPFVRWGCYSDLALELKLVGEQAWAWQSPDGMRYDLTFRSLLILRYSGLIDK